MERHSKEKGEAGGKDKRKAGGDGKGEGKGKAGDADEDKDKVESEGDEVKLLCAVGDTCELCGAWNSIHRCSQCRTAKYCSKECQARHWEDHKDYCKVLVRRTELGMALICASSEGKEQEVFALVSLGAEVGYKREEQPNLGFFPLLIVSHEGHEKVVRALLKAGAKPNQQGGRFSWSALFVAAQKNFPRIACILLAGGADINLGNCNGATPLYAACDNNSLETVKLLVRARGINVNQCKEGGWSPLLAASSKGNAEIVSVLLAAGPEVHHKTETGVTALDAAIYFKHTAVIALLLAHIAQTEGAEAADKAEVGAVLNVLVWKVDGEGKGKEEKRLERLESATLNDSRQGPLFSSRIEILRAAFKG